MRTEVGAFLRYRETRDTISRTVRLPKDVAFPANVREVTILRDGARRIIVPTEPIWVDFLTPRESTSESAISRRTSYVNYFDDMLHVGLYQSLTVTCCAIAAWAG